MVTLLPEKRKARPYMQDNLVIVESPAKAKTIEKFLGKDYKVMSSYGHIRDLKKHELSIDRDTLEPHYVVPDDKKKVVAELAKAAKAAKTVWLASDEDREGEAISWHLCEVLGLDGEKTNRIVFHEITKGAILAAIGSPRRIDMGLVDAQQARRVLDRIVGFKLSPVLWRKVKPALSAGRVQSVAVRLIVEREREIQAFARETYYRVSAVFTPVGGGAEVKAELDRRFATRGEATAFLEKCAKAGFAVESVAKKPLQRSPAPPFTTSTLQQEAARKLGFSVSQTMMVAQKLYEGGLITYMRTDSVNLSKLCLAASKAQVEQAWGGEYSKVRNYHTKAKGAQEAHEAIRPTDMAARTVEGTPQEKKLYELVWKRTIASQMADARIEKTTAVISVEGADERFVATGETTVFDGFLKVYIEGTDDDRQGEGAARSLPPLAEGMPLEAAEIVSAERVSQAPPRYTEASLVKKLEELGIGRPSTYAPTISTIQQREYVAKGESGGESVVFSTDRLSGGRITPGTRTETVGREKGKLVPTDIGTVVNDYLTENFPEIMDYNFTAKVERQFDSIAEGGEDWTEMLRSFDKGFEQSVQQALSSRSQHKAGERQIGTEPGTGKPVFVKIGRYGPVVQIGSAGDKEKPRFAQLPTGKGMDEVTLEDALEMFKLPKTVGQYEGAEVRIGSGRFGPYVQHNGKYASLPKGADPTAVTLEEAVALIEKKREQEARSHIKSFAQAPGTEVRNGRFGPYILHGGKNYRIPKEMQEAAAGLTFEQCMEIVEKSPKAKAKAKA